MRGFKPYKYVKDTSSDPFYKEINWRFFGRTKLFSTGLILLGLLLFTTQVIIPIYFLKTLDTVTRPIAHTVVGKVSGFGDFTFTELNTTKGKNENTDKNKPEFFYITIPRLGIREAVVETDPPDLNPDEALGRYPGTSLPGETGNMFIYGHSVLPMFYNPRNYKSIFSTLGSLQTGDKIIIKYNNNEYTYGVEGKDVIAPEKVDPLMKIKPSYLNEPTITLMTCWPAGTKSKRLIVSGVLLK